LRVSTPEATVFDLVQVRIGGIERAAETLSTLLPLMRIAEMKRALVVENETIASQRLGHVLDRTGNAKLAEVIREWLPSQIPLTPLVPVKIDLTAAPS
jgi:hypothetical protein